MTDVKDVQFDMEEKSLTCECETKANELVDAVEGLGFDAKMTPPSPNIGVSSIDKGVYKLVVEEIDEVRC